MGDYIDRDNWSVKTTATTAEYIEREQALEVINHADFAFDDKNQLVLYADSVQACLLDIPSADVKPVVHGHWKMYDICSVCDELNEFQTNYCPNCGARMDEYDEVD